MCGMVNGHKTEGVRAVTGPVVSGAEANTTVLVALLVIPAKGIASTLRASLVEPAGRQDTTDVLNACHRCTGTHVRNDLNRESGLPQCALVADAIDLVIVRPVMREYLLSPIVFLRPEPVDVDRQLLTHRLVVIEDANLFTDELDDPDGTGISLSPRAANVPVGP